MAGTPKRYKLFAALHEDIAEGFVWFRHDGLPARCVVKITYSNNGRRRAVFCEALQVEGNFLRHYNQEHTKKIKNEDDEILASPMVMNHWYRARLGQPEAPLETQKEYPFEIKAANSWWGRLRACLHHPQVVVRTAVRLGLWSVILTLLSLALAGPGAVRDIRVARSARGTTTALSIANISALSVDGVLAWRGIYGDLLGKPREAVIERFGAPQRENGASLDWNEAPRTGNRPLMVFFDSANKDSSVLGVKVGTLPTERLDVMEVLRKAPMFTFDTGTYTDALLNYFTASTKDGRNAFQFDVTERGAKFRYVIFIKK